MRDPPGGVGFREFLRLEQERLAEYRGLTSGGEGGIMESERHTPATQQA